MRFRRTRSLIFSGVILSVICLQHVYRRNTCTVTNLVAGNIKPMQADGPRGSGGTSKESSDATSQHTIHRHNATFLKQLMESIHLPLLDDGDVHQPGKDLLGISQHEYSRLQKQLPKVPQWQQMTAARWPHRRNFRPNYFLNINNTSHLSNKTFPADDVIIYMHHNKAAGSTTKDCMAKVAFSSHRHLGPVQDSMGRLNVHNIIGQYPDFKNEHNLFMGGYAFGLCDEFNVSCSYFTFLRDPYERTISSYSYCRRARSDQLCAALSAGAVSLREWALHQGSFLFRQLLFDPVFCRHFYDHTEFSNMTGFPHEFMRSKQFSSAPCWFRQKVILNRAFDSAQMDALLNYVIDNLDKWFTVIGLVDEYDLSLAMLQEAYGGLPFHGRCSGRKINVSDYKNMQNKSDTKTNGTTMDIVNESIRELMADPEVRRVLDADARIYKKALQIFERQKRSFFKDIERR